MIARVLGSLALILLSPLAFTSEPARSAHDFTFNSIEGNHLPLSDFEGQVVLVVNTASFCGFTRQYDDLQDVWQRYRDSGLVVLGVPSNDFGNQEPGTEAEIKDFCEINFAIDFPMTEKVRVKGEDAHPFYRWAAEKLGTEARPRWNFHKYLVGPDGHLVGWFPTATKPTSTEVINAIETQLKSTGPDGSWTLRFQDNERFTGTADDVVGEAQGMQAGNAATMTYRLRIPREDDEITVSMEDWFYLQDDGTLINKTKMRKYGLTVGELVIAFRKQPE